MKTQRNVDGNAPDLLVKKPVERRSARDQAMRYLEYRARTQAEVARHLAEREYSPEEIEECMEFLRDCHFTDDEQYCLRYIEYSMEKGRGPLRIRQELSQKGISGEMVQNALEELYGPEEQLAAALRQAKKALGISEYGDPGSGEDGFSEKELARAARRLAGQGFPQSVAYKAISRLRG